ncbi:hypothetical protein [Amycolatopsis magusensis]|uniref:Uncharacterized protein n=1 Tax=Amycolatopsis magusensis TaxID=882444 RepID=A0ABS4PLW5_9PSEU|nr:hypothetical protein [Amycolatopsis magusensis]MBP2180419.1 hypothetical protein [Amycolatopsis magusensis]MDI5981005.1 hypothetical protein [Amycolatopsis magusensis]UJW33575.1 hypothetical protein L3Q67_07325 [Saccharothrix sp. AJ9571]
MNTEQNEWTEPVAEPTGRRAAPEGAPRHPLIDLSRDPNPGRPDHAKPED